MNCKRACSWQQSMTRHIAREEPRLGAKPCRTLLAREQQRMRSEYEQRLRDLESERLTAEHDKAKARASHLVSASCSRRCSRNELKALLTPPLAAHPVMLCMSPAWLLQIRS